MNILWASPVAHSCVCHFVSEHLQRHSIRNSSTIVPGFTNSGRSVSALAVVCDIEIGPTRSCHTIAVPTIIFERQQPNPFAYCFLSSPMKALDMSRRRPPQPLHDPRTTTDPQRWAAATTATATTGGFDPLDMDDLSIASDAISCSDTALLLDDGNDDITETMDDFFSSNKNYHKSPRGECQSLAVAMPGSLLSQLNVSLPVASLEPSPPRLVVLPRRNTRGHTDADAVTSSRLPDKPHTNLKSPKLLSTKATSKRPRRVVDQPPLHDMLLHRACCKPQVSLQEIEDILQWLPITATSQSHTITTTVSVYNPRLQKVERLTQKQPFTYPLHLAIYHKSAFSVVQRLVQTDSSILGVLDGTNRESPLALLLRIAPNDTQTLDLLLHWYPKAAALTDRYESTPLHVACCRGSPLHTVSQLCAVYPQAIHRRNFHGKTPLELSQQMTAHCSDDVALFLLELSTSMFHRIRLQSE